MALLRNLAFIVARSGAGTSFVNRTVSHHCEREDAFHLNVITVQVENYDCSCE